MAIRIYLRELEHRQSTDDGQTADDRQTADGRQTADRETKP